ncbi:MAG: hypothetical protein BWX66_01614 [Deltaproteobacteria bacterium ADurb.Bin058]|nr:MAG: hypothetical protein BWX66_01614 [Deltaproteobacteria bacterium ADurb.Bin058]
MKNSRPFPHRSRYLGHRILLSRHLLSANTKVYHLNSTACRIYKHQAYLCHSFGHHQSYLRLSPHHSRCLGHHRLHGTMVFSVRKPVIRFYTPACRLCKHHPSVCHNLGHLLENFRPSPHHSRCLGHHRFHGTMAFSVRKPVLRFYRPTCRLCKHPVYRCHNSGHLQEHLHQSRHHSRRPSHCTFPQMPALSGYRRMPP